MELCFQHKTEDIGRGIFAISSPPIGFWQYLILGNEKALLVDSGFGFGSLKKVVDGITNQPIILVNTHGHPDHCGGNAEFEDCYMHPADVKVFSVKCSLESRNAEAALWGIADAEKRLSPSAKLPKPISEGDVFDLGCRALEIIHTPGHTKGSVSVFDSFTGSLFAGDNILGRATNLTDEYSASVEEYLSSMRKLRELPVSRIYSGHMPNILEPDYIERKISCAEAILSGEKGRYIKTPIAEGYMVEYKGTGVIYKK